MPPRPSPPPGRVSAATAFQNLIDRFDDDARKVQEALRAIAEQIASSADVYARQEEENKSAVSDVIEPPRLIVLTSSPRQLSQYQTQTSRGD